VADERDELALGHVQVDVAQRHEAAPWRLERLLDAVDLDVLVAMRRRFSDFTSSNVNAVASLMSANSSTRPTMPITKIAMMMLA
jgi:hypothetical protein